METEHWRNGKTAERRIVLAPSHRFSDSPDDSTGMRVPPGDAEAMAEAIIMLLTNDALRMRLGLNATEDARRRFDLKQQVEAYLGWYDELISMSERRKG